MWAGVLAEVGIVVETVDADRVRLRGEVGEAVYWLRRSSHRIHPSRLVAPAQTPALLSIPTATDATAHAASQQGWNLVTDDGTLRLRLGDHELHLDKPTGETRRIHRRGPTSWATFTLVRRLLAGPPAIQRELAERTGVTQSKVSRALNRLRAHDLVRRDTTGWQATDFDALLDWWLENYPGPGGVTSHWYSLDNAVAQAQKALDLLGDRAAVSGDPAADALAPWRRPATCTIYVHAGASLTPAGFVPVASAAESTLTMCAPKDPGLWLPTTWTAAGLPLADPVQIIHDVVNGTGTDQAEAAGHLREALRTTVRPRWQNAVTGGAP